MVRSVFAGRPLARDAPGSSFLVGSPLQSSFISTPAQVFRRGRSCRGFAPHRGKTGDVNSYENCDVLATFRPQAFAASRRFAPSSSSTGLFHPAATSRVKFRSGASLFAKPRLSRRKAVPPCRCRRCAHGPKTAATLGRLDFEALIHAKKRFSGLVFSRPLGRSPLRFSSSPRFSTFIVRTGYPAPIALGVHRFALSLFARCDGRSRFARSR